MANGQRQQQQEQQQRRIAHLVMLQAHRHIHGNVYVCVFRFPAKVPKTAASKVAGKSINLKYFELLSSSVTVVSFISFNLYTL